ncbi:Phophatidylserine decarboxylase-domain-containing protein [Crepidotus variabilis]|uniref:Phophatidylserine decarboxylase-domain-containing protein n=1 Tax=Crepidotus variabilis TaxID=179855 RepID=A0A9P6JI87_9AGAR|nr:Phophatidylserine decarboxylase-domain-containing protein [Crepidotus variabilis]
MNILNSKQPISTVVRLLHSGWAPPTEEALHEFIKGEIHEAKKEDRKYHAVIQEFKDLIESDPNIYINFIEMFKEVPQPAKVPDYETMLMLLNRAIRRIPTYDPNEEFSGLYIHAVLMAVIVIVTEHGYNAFTNDKVNAQFRKILQEWSDFLASPPSAEVLTSTSGGWFSPNVVKIFETYRHQQRMRIFIESDNPDIGLMCFIAVGMIEVSSCDITVQEGHRVKRGDQLGTFHYGGSTHCLVFRPQTKLDFAVNEATGHVPLRSAIARARRA